MTSTTFSVKTAVTDGKHLARWLGETDAVVFDTTQLPDRVWSAILVDAQATYSDELLGFDADDKCVYGRNESFLGERVAYSGHVYQAAPTACDHETEGTWDAPCEVGRPNRYHPDHTVKCDLGDEWVVSYVYDERGYCALVGVSPDPTAPLGYKVACYAN